MHWKSHELLNQDKDEGQIAGASTTLIPTINAMSSKGMPDGLDRLAEKLVSSAPNGRPVWRPKGKLAIVYHKGTRKWSSYIQLVCHSCKCMTQPHGAWVNDAVWKVVADFLERAAHVPQQRGVNDPVGLHDAAQRDNPAAWKATHRVRRR